MLAKNQIFYFGIVKAIDISQESFVAQLSKLFPLVIFIGETFCLYDLNQFNEFFLNLLILNCIFDLLLSQGSQKLSNNLLLTTKKSF
jgi:hypothetical protein